MGIRFYFIIFCFALFYGALASWMYHIQINKRDFYTARATSQILNRSIDPIRGNIFATDKNQALIPIAINKNYSFIFAVPENMARANVDVKKVAEQLSNILEMDSDRILSRINRPNDPFEELSDEVSEETAVKIRELNISGIHIGTRLKRYYPYGTIGAHILGFISNQRGQYGIEAHYNNRLSGVPGKIDKDIFIPSKDGEDIMLTIDQIIQARAEKVLSDTVNQFNAEGGVVIVSHPQTGAIKAMAGYPSFNPNNFGSAQMSKFVNHNVQSVYEPGSVFKLITMAGAIDSLAVTPETTYVDRGSLTINNRTISNWDGKAHGTLTMNQVMERSINTGTVFAVQQMGRENFLHYLNRFGFTSRTGINLPGEVIGSIRPLINGRDINFATASYGQGISVTPIRMLTAINAIANNGIMMTPRITKGEPKVESRPISKETARKMTDMMVSTVQKNVVADIPGFSVAGKTGTAMVPDLKLGGYKDAYINTYIGFAPAYDPKFSILIRIDKPEGNPLAGATVVPAFRSLSEFILSYYNIPPDRIN